MLRRRSLASALLLALLAVLVLAVPSQAAAPVAANDSDVGSGCSVNCGIRAWPRGTQDVLGNDTGDGIRVVSNTQPAHGTASCDALGACLYTGNAGYVGADAFDYTIRDGTGDTATATVAVDVSAPPAGNAVIPADDQFATLAGHAKTVTPLANDQGTAPLTITGVDVNPSHGTVDCSAATSCLYTPAAGYTGTDGFRYRVHDGDGHEDTADVHMLVVPASTHYALTGAGGPLGGGGTIAPGGKGTWGFGAAAVPSDTALEELAALPLPSVSASLAGPHTLDAGSVKAAPGWNASVSGGVATATAGSDALVGDAVTEAFPKPLPPISQGSGGDGHVPILAGSKVFAFYHHSGPTSATCLDRRTGALCAGYPTNGIRIQASSANDNGPGAVVGHELFTHLWPKGYYGSGYAETAPVALYCWDTKTNDPCGWVILDRVAGTGNPGGSPPVLVDGKVYMTADTGKLYCYDPATKTKCGTIDTGLATGSFAQYDIVTHGTKVFVSRSGDKVMCLDVAAGAKCAGWSGPVSLGGRFDLINQFASDGSGRAIGVCAISSGAMDCIHDDGTGQTSGGFLDYIETSYSETSEAETGTRTLLGAHSRGGLGCWDWTTGAKCTGANFDGNGWVTGGLPTAYGAVWDGSCAVALGDPGQVYTVDANGNSPCLSLSTGTGKRVIDLRSQRCDGTVGSAKWLRVSLSDFDNTPPREVPAARRSLTGRVAGELDTVIVTVRDADTGEVLASGDLMQGSHTLDLSGIDPVKHPRVTLDANATGPSSNIAWDDAIPPRLRLTWKADPQAMCFTTTTPDSCGQPARTVSATGHLAQTGEDKRIDVGLDASKPCAVVAQSKPKTCGGRRSFNIRVRYLGNKIKRITVTANGKRQRVVGLRKYRGRPVAVINLKGLSRQTVVVRITITTKSYRTKHGKLVKSRTLKGKRVYHPCTKKLPDRGFTL